MRHSGRQALRQFGLRLRELGQNLLHRKDYAERKGGRQWEDYYRRRWQYDKVVRSTHGVNCTGSCSFDVFVKDGVIVWEAQKTDYPSAHPDFPDYEPRGCPRGVSASWYVYSPLRVRHPLIRADLLQRWRTALAATGPVSDPVLAWARLMDDTAARAQSHARRGKGGFVRVSWEEAETMIAAALVHTIKKYGPDRVFGFTPLPAMSMVGFASGARFFNLLGGSMISFYDWYCDLPPASPQIWGDQTDVPESADWYNAGYIIAWGSNIPLTRTPDAHFYVEARYRGTKIAAVSPDYADYAKFADHWLPAKAGTDAALALAMARVVLNECYLARRVPAFEDYALQFTDLPCLVLLEEQDGALLAGRFVRADDVGRQGNNPQWKTVVYDQNRKAPAVPNGSIGTRYGEQGTWNLRLQDCEDGKELAPVLSLAEPFVGNSDFTPVRATVHFPRFDAESPALRSMDIPCARMKIMGRERLVTTVFDLLTADLGLSRYADQKDDVYASPEWQTPITGVPAEQAVRVALEFARNAEQTGGKSMIIMGAGINHWYNNDLTYRAILALTTLCGCQGVNGGGWAHYVGQEKVRPLSGWTTVSMASDWIEPPRLQNGTSFYYFATDAWRYELLDMKAMCPPALNNGLSNSLPAHPADCNAKAVRMGWLPFYPQFNENPLEVCHKAQEAGATTPDDMIHHAVQRLKSGDLDMAVHAPSSASNVPRFMMFWRTNPLGSNVKGHEYFLRHLLGTENAVRGEESAHYPESVSTQSHSISDKTNANMGGKLDLVVTSDFRMSTTCLYSDIVLPAAHWYECHDLSSTDMHPFIHPFTQATDPAWESRENWDMFKGIAEAFSRMAQKHLGTRHDIVAAPLQHDTPGEIAQPLGEVRDWYLGECDPVPGKTMPNLRIVTRHYGDIAAMHSALGPNIARPGGMGAKGVRWDGTEEHEYLKSLLGVVREENCACGLPRLFSSKDVCETILALSPESNGRVSLRSWEGLEKQTGTTLRQLSVPSGSPRNAFSATATPPGKRTPLAAPRKAGKKAKFTVHLKLSARWKRPTSKRLWPKSASQRGRLAHLPCWLLLHGCCCAAA